MGRGIRRRTFRVFRVFRSGQSPLFPVWTFPSFQQDWGATSNAQHPMSNSPRKCLDFQNPHLDVGRWTWDVGCSIRFLSIGHNLNGLRLPHSRKWGMSSVSCLLTERPFGHRVTPGWNGSAREAVANMNLKDPDFCESHCPLCTNARKGHTLARILQKMEMVVTFGGCPSGRARKRKYGVAPNEALPSEAPAAETTPQPD